MAVEQKGPLGNTCPNGHLGPGILKNTMQPYPAALIDCSTLEND